MLAPDAPTPAFAAPLALPLRGARAASAAPAARRQAHPAQPRRARRTRAPAHAPTSPPPPRASPRAEMVRVSVPLRVEAPPHFCFDLFADLSRMPAWSASLQAVSRDTADPALSTWAFAWRGVRLSWRARDAPLAPAEQGRVIRWAAVSGLPHEGEVTFDAADARARPDSASVSSQSSAPAQTQSQSAVQTPQQARTDAPEAPAAHAAAATDLTLTVDYDVGQLLAALARVPFVSNFVESAIRADLQRFRSYALRTYRAERRRRASAS